MALKPVGTLVPPLLVAGVPITYDQEVVLYSGLLYKMGNYFFDI